jgi:hypothetical protein
LTTIRTLFWVVREDPATLPGTRLLLGDSQGTFDFWGGTSSLWHPASSVSVRDGATWLDGIPVDGVTTERPTTFAILSLVTTANVTADNFAQYLNQGTTSWSGDLAELIIYEAPLSAQHRRAVEDYLAVKYRPYAAAAATPLVSPAGGRFTGNATVTLSTATPAAVIHFTTDGTEPTESSPMYGEPFVIATTTTVKARSYRHDLLPSFTATAGFLSGDAFSPMSLGGLRLWLRADAGIATSAGDHVVHWQDQSGQGNHAAQTVGVSIPRLVPNALAALPVLRFDGAGDFLRLTNRLTTVRSVFWVVRRDSSAAGPRLLLGDTWGTFEFGTGTTTLWSPTWTSLAVRNGATTINGLPVDGTQAPWPGGYSILSVVTTANTTADTFARYLAQNTYDWPGDLAELIIFDTALSAEDRRRVEDYLNSRYHLFLR